MGCASTTAVITRRCRTCWGAGYITDIDQYLIDDDTYGNQLQNDLRHPDRTIREGDRFGYDYTLSARSGASVFPDGPPLGPLPRDVWVSLGSSAVNRRGHYEKELFPGSQSCGRSRVLRFAPHAAGHLRLVATPRQYVGLSLLAAARTPDAGDLFYQPLYNNRTLEIPFRAHLRRQAVWRLTGPVVNLQTTLFAVLTLDGSGDPPLLATTFRTSIATWR